MKNKLLTILLLLFAASGVSAQKNLLFKTASVNYDVKINIENCDEDGVCEGKGTVYLMKKNQKQVFQTIQMEEMRLTMGENRKETADLIVLTGTTNGGVRFEDYNFDGAKDLVLANGNYKPYGGISYDVFLYKKATGKFVKHDGLTELETESMSVEINKKLKTIETSTRTGCCLNETTRYRFVNSQLVKFYVLTEDAMSDGEKVTITTETLVGKKWKKTTKVERKKNDR